MGKVDRNEAPKGYVAKRAGGKKEYCCTHCAFSREGSCCGVKCMSAERKDGQSVIFVKKFDTK